MNKIFSIIIALAFGVMVYSCSAIKDGEYNIELYSQNDIHGRYFDSLYVSDKANDASLANISYFVNQRRETVGKDNVVLVDVGDNLQGDNAAYFYNYVYNTKGEVSNEKHLFSRIVDYIGYDAVVVGNHDIEASHPVYDRIKRELTVPYLAANIIDVNTGKSYFDSYTILNKNGIKIAFIGMSNANIKSWLGESLWSGMDFLSLSSIADSIVNHVNNTYKPHITVLAVHAGIGDGSNDLENPAKYLASTVKGVDIVLAAHDHRSYCQKVYNGADSVLLIDAASRAVKLSGINIKLNIKNGKVASKQISGSLIDMTSQPKDTNYLNLFRPDYLRVKEFTNKKIGVLNKDIYTNEAFVGPSDYLNLIQQVQINASGAQLSMAAPLTRDKFVKAGDLNFNDLFTIYPFENQLYKIELTGEQVKNYLEYSYNNWIQTISKEGDHILKITYDNRSGQYRFVDLTFNFDSAYGINYTVDVTKPFGSRINISSFTNGNPFKFDEKYTVAISSYRASGGGDLLEKGAGIAKSELNNIIIDKYSQIRDLIYDYFSQGNTLNETSPNWKFIPDNLVSKAIERDRALVFNKK